MYKSSTILFAFVALIGISLILGCTSTSTPGPRIIKAEDVGKIPTPVSPPTKLPLPSAEVKQAYTEAFGPPKYILGPGDVIEISVWVGRQEQKSTVPISEEGTITFTYLDNIQVSGLTISQVRKLLLKELSEYIIEPRVNVFVNKYHSKVVSVFGEIRGGHYPLTGKTTVLDLLIKAGADLTKADLNKVRVIRRGKSYELNLYRTIFQGDASQNITLEPGDAIMVAGLASPANQVHVLGEVKKPGAYLCSYDMNLITAISRAGGLTEVAVTENVVVIRGGFENPTLIASNMKRFFEEADLSQNINLQGGDVVYVPRTVLGDIRAFAQTLLPVLGLGRVPADYWNAYRGKLLFGPDYSP